MDKIKKFNKDRIELYKRKDLDMDDFGKEYSNILAELKKKISKTEYHDIIKKRYNYLINKDKGINNFTVAWIATTVPTVFFEFNNISFDNCNGISEKIRNFVEMFLESGWKTLLIFAVCFIIVIFLALKTNTKDGTIKNNIEITQLAKEMSIEHLTTELYYDEKDIFSSLFKSGLFSVVLSVVLTFLVKFWK